MASGRVGGTRSKKSGEVGTNIYEVRRNPDGTYSQVVYAKGQKTIETITPRLMAQRMCTAMVESLMRDLKEVAKICMQSAANKSKSLNAFSSWNLQRLAQDCKLNWYGNNQFVYPYTLDVLSSNIDLGGPYLMSAGTLQFQTFDDMITQPMAGRFYNGVSYPKNHIYGLKFITPIGAVTLAQFMRAHRMSRLDIIAFPFFRYWYELNPKTEEQEERVKNSYILLQLNAQMPDNTILDASTIPNIFVTKSSVDCGVWLAKDGSNFVVGYAANEDELSEEIYYYAGFTISYLDGRKKISTSYYRNPDGKTTPYFLHQAPANVFGSWMGEPQIDPYPSPFV